VKEYRLPVTAADAVTPEDYRAVREYKPPAEGDRIGQSRVGEIGSDRMSACDCKSPEHLEAGKSA
jgi:hypothetical protein